MLKLSYFYKTRIQEEYKKIIYDEKYKYYFCQCFWNYEFPLSTGDSDWYGIEYVSVDRNNNIIGYLGANIDRESNKVSSLRILNFKDKGNITFSRDLRNFIIELFERYKVNKIEFSVVGGNPIEKMYDKYIKKYNGRIVGHFKDYVKLTDGEYHDYKMYEIFKKDFQLTIK
jgi:hypothetical protein